MAKQIIWSLRANNEKKEILSYWSERNKSKSNSKKLHQQFKDAAQLLSKHPNIGRPTNEASVRIKLVKDYLLIYEVTATAIHILSIWDGRQDPHQLDDMF